MTPTPFPVSLPRCPRYASLDMWRGIACLSVVIYHSRYCIVPGPAHGTIAILEAGIIFLLSKFLLGVQLFFVISGYCIAASCDADRRDPIGFALFMGRRFRRIYPPYWIFLILVIGLSTLLPFGIADSVQENLSGALALDFSQAIGNLLLIESWRAHLFGSVRHYFLGPSWTLCYEEQFYLVCGLLLALARQSFFRAVLIVTLLSLVPTALYWAGIVNFNGFFFDGYWLQFAAGVLVYYIRNYCDKRAAVGTVVLLFVLSSLLMVLRYLLPDIFLFGSSRAAMLDGSTWAFLFAAALLVLSPYDIRIANWRFVKPLTYCGKRCYSLYLVHYPIVGWVTFSLSQIGLKSVAGSVFIVIPIAILVSVAAASIFYHYVEKRFLSRRKASVEA